MTIREQAEYRRLLLALGLIVPPDVIAWADHLVMETTAPAEVIDVSLAVGAAEHELDDLLKRIPGDGDLTLAAHAALARLRTALREQPLAEAVRRVVCYGNCAVLSEQERFDATLFDVLYEDMVSGFWGDEQHLSQMLEDFFNRYGSGTAELTRDASDACDGRRGGGPAL